MDGTRRQFSGPGIESQYRLPSRGGVIACVGPLACILGLDVARKTNSDGQTFDNEWDIAARGYLCYQDHV